MALGKSQVGPAGPTGKSITPTPQGRQLRPGEERGLTEGAGLPLCRPPDPCLPDRPPAAPTGPARLAVALSPVLNPGQAKGWAGARGAPGVIRANRRFLLAS